MVKNGQFFPPTTRFVCLKRKNENKYFIYNRKTIGYITSIAKYSMNKVETNV